MTAPDPQPSDKDEALSRLQADVIEGIESGPSIEVTDEYLIQKLSKLQNLLHTQSKP